MRVLVSGASGLVGSALVESLIARGEEVIRLVRPGRTASETTVVWDPGQGKLSPSDLEGFDAVVHLAGESIAGGLWTAKRKRQIMASRVDSTQLLAEQLIQLKRPPAVLLCASAVGYYGDCSSGVSDESSPSGAGFLAAVCRAWEAAAAPARSRGIRVVHLRFGMVLSSWGGALKAMLPIFRAGLGGPIGNGHQYLSWIELADSIRALIYALEEDHLQGAINAASPRPVTNEEFSHTLGRVLGRPSRLRLPAFAIRLGLGQMGRELLLFSNRAIPQRLLKAGFVFKTPTLEEGLQRALEPRRG